MLFHSKCHSPIERARIAGGMGEHAQGVEWERARVGSGVPIEWEGKARACAVWVFEAGQVDPHTPIEVGVGSHVLHELLFVCDIHCVNPRVRIVLTEYRYADKRGKRPRRQYGIGYRIRVRRKRNLVGEYASSNGLLLYAVRCDRSYLCQHVLPRIENAPARPERRFSITPNVPSESDTRLEHLVLVWQKTCRWKSRITQVLAVGCF